jgi:hypothetical protein
VIRPTSDGFRIEIIRSDFSLRVIPVHRGREQHAFRTIMNYHSSGLLTDDQTAMALCALNSLIPSSERKWTASLAAVLDTLASWFVGKVLRVSDEQCCGK